MRDVLAGGILVIGEKAETLSPTNALPRRRRTERTRTAPVWTAPCSKVQPGQLTSPFLKYGFPSVALH